MADREMHHQGAGETGCAVRGSDQGESPSHDRQPFGAATVPADRDDRRPGGIPQADPADPSQAIEHRGIGQQPSGASGLGGEVIGRRLLEGLPTDFLVLVMSFDRSAMAATLLEPGADDDHRTESGKQREPR